MSDLNADLKRVAKWITAADSSRLNEQVRQCAAGLLLLDMQERVRSGEAGKITWTAWYEASKPRVTLNQAQSYMRLASRADEVTMGNAKKFITKAQKGGSPTNMPKRNDPVEAIKKAILKLTDDDQRRTVLLWMNEQYGDLSRAL